MTKMFHASKLLSGTESMDDPFIEVEEGVITKISCARKSDNLRNIHSFENAVITPTLFDIHLHGAAGHDVMQTNAEALPNICTFLARRGVSRFLATTVTASLDLTFRSLEAIANHIGADKHGLAKIAGIHIEGPFLSHTKRGMHSSEHLLVPSPTLLNRFWEAARGHIKLMTIAPELPGATETILRATELGIRTSLGHSDAGAEETLAAIAAGATSATHTFNAMRPLSHRDPGILGIVLDREDLFADLICDGLHVAPELVRLWLKAKGLHRAILISDSLEATGMPDRNYQVGETEFRVHGGRCTTKEGVLAGSVITLDRAVEKLQAFTGTSLGNAIRAASTNPAEMLSLPQDLCVGAPANFNVYSPDGARLYTIIQGRVVS